VSARIRSLRLAVPATAALLFTGLALADPPDAVLNPVSGAIEVVDVVVAGGGTHVRHTLNQGQQTLEVSELSSGSVTDVSPRVCVSGDGHAWVTWWRDGETRQVLVRKRAHGGSWDAERLVSVPTESSRKPRIAHDGTSPWVAYEHVLGEGTGIAVAPIIDGPDPITPVTLGSTSYSGNVDVRVHAASGHLWVTWVDSASDVGWSRYDPGNEVWSGVERESYATDSVTAALARIEAEVLEN
jgi:hypothetical protein